MVCLLVSNNSKTIFMGGGQDTQGHKAKIIAVNFSTQMNVVNTVLIEEHDFSIVWSMERYPNSDILFAGSYGGIAIFFFTGTEIHLLSTIKGKGELDPIKEMHFLKSALYCIDQPSRVLYKFDFSEKNEDDKQFRSRPLETNKLKILSEEYQKPKRDIISLSGMLKLNRTFRTPQGVQ